MANKRPLFDDDPGERAASVLGPESDLFGDLDAAGFADALRQALQASLASPGAPVAAAVRLAGDLARIPLAGAAKALGRDVDPPVPVDPKDRRFADPAWTSNPAFYAVRLAYLAGSRFARDVVGSAKVPPNVAAKATWRPT
jgi:polyhydroxyalkanoate synthase